MATKKKSSASSRPEKRVVWSEADTVAYRKSPQYKRDLKRAMKIRDEDIDFSDIPQLTDEQLGRMIRNRAARLARAKRSITIRIDPDILAWLKSDGPGYQSRINALLRDAMAKQSSRRSA